MTLQFYASTYHKTLQVGESLLISPVRPNSNSAFANTYENSNGSVAGVTIEKTSNYTSGNISYYRYNFTITGLKSGITTINLGFKDSYFVGYDTYIVTVVEVKSISIPNNLSIFIGDSYTFSPVILEEGANTTLSWSSSNTSTATIDAKGKLTTKGVGTCQIKATANDGSGKTASCLVTVEKNNKLTVANVAQCNGGRGMMNVLLTDEETILGFQFDLLLPDGVTVPYDDNNKLMATLTGNAATTHNLSSSKVSEGLYRFLVSPKGNSPISNATGDGMAITIDVADNVAVGNYVISIKDIEMTVKRGNAYEDVHPIDNTATLAISEATAGDVNGDARISVTDVISIIGYLHENPPSKFISKAADVNNDGKITITDAVLIIDMILAQGNSSVRQQKAPIVEPQ